MTDAEVGPHLVGKLILADRDIIEEIQTKINGLALNHGLEPHSILLGPNEYLRLVTEVARLQGGPLPRLNLAIRELLGYEIRVKLQPGIDLEVHVLEAPYFAIGSIR